MANISQTDETIEIVIHLNRISTVKPDIVLFKNFVKFNSPPAYFECFLTNEVDEENSVCKLTKKEARLVLKKKTIGIWPSILEDVTKQDALNRKKALDEQLRTKAQEKEKEAIIKYENTRRNEIQKVVERESNRREKITSFEKESCKQELAEIKTEVPITKPIKVCNPPRTLSIRKSGKISFEFSDFNLRTPKRESQN